MSVCMYRHLKKLIKKYVINVVKQTVIRYFKTAFKSRN